jgi:hypothetical protein
MASFTSIITLIIAKILILIITTFNLASLINFFLAIATLSFTLLLKVD